MDAKLLVLTILAIALLYVVLPVALDVHRRFRGKRTVVCPETGNAEEIRLDAWHAAATAVPGPPRRYVVACTRWPAGEDCRQGCVASAPENDTTAADA
jgi:hypothetical protein